MAYFTLGHDWSEDGEIQLPLSRWGLNEQGLTAETVVRTLFENWEVSVPVVGTSHPLRPKVKFRSATVNQLANPGHLADVTLFWEQDEADETQPVPPTQISENGTSIEVDIQSHPDWESEFQQYWDKETKQFNDDAPAWLKGFRTGFNRGSTTVTVTVFSREEPPDVQGDLNRILTPPGRGNAGHWLVVSGSKNKSGAFWARSLTYFYSTTPWPTELYS